MDKTMQKKLVVRPLGRSIAIGCILFIVTLCIVLGITSFFNYRRALYQRYEAYITDILHYVDRQIDDDDLARCAATLERSEKFDALEKFMDSIKEDFDIHYLYILTPIRKNGVGKIMSIISAENYYDRYVSTEGNLYLGWISDDEYDEATVEELFAIMQRKDIVFYEEATEWGVDYTGSLTLFDSQKKPYAILCVDVDITDITRLIRKRTLESFLLIILLGAFFTLIFLFWTRINITKPIKRLEKSVVAFANKSHGQRDTSLLTFDKPEITVKNEISNLSTAVNQMTVDIRDYVDGIIQAERKAEILREHANQMTELANKDALTGIRNKTAYDKEIKNLEYALSTGSLAEFGLAMIDLNFLKKINDTYGHEQGNFAIKKLCALVCTTFGHSPVFRIGGDEFVVILQGEDYSNTNLLVESFKQRLEDIAKDDTLEPWEKVSAAIGVASFDKEIDADVVNVFKRADKKMYECKEAMKARRND